MRTINIIKNSLEKSIREAYLKTLDFELSGWRIPIYINEQKGECSIGNFLSDNSHQTDLHELPIHVVRWTMDEMGFDNYDDNDLEYELKEKIDWYIELIESNSDNITYKVI